MDYARAIRTVRAHRGLSQQELAIQMDVDEAFLSRLGKGDSTPSGKTLEKVAGALGIPLYLLVLLASDEEDLKTMSKEQADVLGRQLIEMLLSKEKQENSSVEKKRKSATRLSKRT